MSLDVAVVDFGGGNLRSVIHSLTSQGAKPYLTTTKQGIDRADRIVFPGVGAFGPCMQRLQELKLIEPLKQAIQDKPFLGICLGLQLLFESSDESTGQAGLGIFSGKIRHLRNYPNSELKVPQMGWAPVELTKEALLHPMLDGMQAKEFFYHVHSYALPMQIAKEQDIGLASVLHRFDLATIIAKDNVFATQFHPEKSSHAGLTLLKNFIHWRP